MSDTPTERFSDSDTAFFHGVLSALAVARFGPTRLYDDIVAGCGGERLVTIARKSGTMRISGMVDYLRRRKRNV